MRRKIYTPTLVARIQEALKGCADYSLEDMAKHLNSNEVQTVRGQKWTPVNVHNFITRYGGPGYKRTRKARTVATTATRTDLVEVILSAGYNKQKTASIIEAIYGA